MYGYEEEEHEENEADAEVEEHHKNKKSDNLFDLDLMGGIENDDSSMFEIPNYAGEVDKKIRSKKQDDFFSPDSW
jgi:hypothetical protein